MIVGNLLTTELNTTWTGLLEATQLIYWWLYIGQNTDIGLASRRMSLDLYAVFYIVSGTTTSSSFILFLVASKLLLKVY